MAADASIVDFQQAGTGAVVRTAQDRLREWVSVKDFGAVGDGVADDTAAILEWHAAEGIAVVPNGNYITAGSAGAPSAPRLTLAGNSKDDSVEVPFVSVSREGFGALPKNLLFIQQDTNYRSDAQAVQIQRLVNTNDGLLNPKALRVVTYKNNSNAQTEWAISGELNNYSNINSTGDTAVSGVSNKFGVAPVFAGHLQSKDYNLYVDPIDVTSLIGLEINTPSVGLDHPTSNGGFGNRRCLDIIARTNEEVENWSVGPGNYGAGETGIGIDVRTDNVTQGYFRFGVVVREIWGNPNKINTAFYSNASGYYGLRLVGANTGASISVEGNANTGLLMSGAFGSAAIRIPAAQYIAMESTGVIKTAFGVTNSVWGFYNDSSECFGFVMTASPALRINGVSVVGSRKSGWSAPSGTATRTSFNTDTVTTSHLAERVKALIDDLGAMSGGHGLIGA
jgi:hypothetical protein